MPVFQVEAEGDTLYIEAPTESAAYEKLVAFLGPVPKEILTWTQVRDVPEGEEIL